MVASSFLSEYRTAAAEREAQGVPALPLTAPQAEALTELLADAATKLLGRDQVLWLEQPSLGAEDFAELQQGTPATMFRLGVAGPKGCTPLHSNSFDADEGSLAVGVQVLSASLLQWLARQDGR